MTLNILVSFSLLALVVTARPLSNGPQSVRRSLQLQNAVQAIFESRTGHSPDCLTCEDDDDIHVSLTTSEEQTALLSNLDDLGAVKAIIPLSIDGSPSEDEKELYELLAKLKSTGSLGDIDGDTLSHGGASSDLMAEATSPEDASTSDAAFDSTVAPIPDFYKSPPLLVLAVSSIAALLAVLCIGAGLYAYSHVNALIIESSWAWDSLPRLEKRVGLDTAEDDDSEGDRTLRYEKRQLLLDTSLPTASMNRERIEVDLDENQWLVDVSEPLSDDDDDEGPDEKFHDAQEHSLLFLDSHLAAQRHSKLDVPLIVIEEHPDPDLLPLPEKSSDHFTPFVTPLRTPLGSPFASPTRSPARHAAQMSELQPSPTFASKPLWSLRAADAPALGLADQSPVPTAHLRTESPTPQLPGSLFADDAPEMVEIQRPRQRLPRQPLDIAFALQLRPGLGLGADSAWLVRFLMAMFGWMTFFVGGRPPRVDARRSLTT